MKQELLDARGTGGQQIVVGQTVPSLKSLKKAEVKLYVDQLTKWGNSGQKLNVVGSMNSEILAEVTSRMWLKKVLTETDVSLSGKDLDGQPLNSDCWDNKSWSEIKELFEETFELKKKDLDSTQSMEDMMISKSLFLHAGQITNENRDLVTTWVRHVTDVFVASGNQMNLLQEAEYNSTEEFNAEREHHQRTMKRILKDGMNKKDAPMKQMYEYISHKQLPHGMQGFVQEVAQAYMLIEKVLMEAFAVSGISSDKQLIGVAAKGNRSEAAKGGKKEETKPARPRTDGQSKGELRRLPVIHVVVVIMCVRIVISLSILIATRRRG